MGDFGINFADISHEKRVLYLAGLLLPDGKPRFPMLRKPCPFGHGYGCGQGPPCACCQGRGWVPVVTLEALLKAVDSFGQWRLERDTGPQLEATVDGCWPVREDGPADALSLALCKWVGR